MDCGMKVIKYLIFLFNFLLLFMGLALIVLGVLMEINYKDVFIFFPAKVNFIHIFIIVVGSIIFLIAFFGCCGAIMGSYSMIVIYILLLTLVALVQVGVCITAFKMKNEVEETLELNMKETIPNYNEQNKALSYTWNSLQLNLMCCGVNDYKDWKLNEVMGYDKANKVPDACCINTKQGCGSYTDIGTIYSQGCLPKLKTLIDDNALVLAFLAGIFVFIQIAGIVFASCLAFSLKKDYESMK